MFNTIDMICKTITQREYYVTRMVVVEDYNLGNEKGGRYIPINQARKEKIVRLLKDKNIK